MLENRSSDMDVERIMHEIRDAVARQHRAAGVDSSPAAVAYPTTYVPDNSDSVRLQPPFQPRLDNHYHVNDLLRFHGAEFVRNAYLALLSREPDQTGTTQHLQNLGSGRFNKIDVLASLHSSPEGRRRGVRLDGLSLRVAVRRFGRIPVIGYFVRLLTALFRLPVSLQHQNQFEFYLWSQFERLVDYQNQSRKEAAEALDSALRQYEELTLKQAELGSVIDAGLRQVREALNHSTGKLSEQIATQNAQQQEAISKQAGEGQALASRIRELIESQQALHGELRTQERRVAVLLEALRHNGPADHESSFSREATAEEAHLLDHLYASFEDRFRGKPEEVQRRLEVYLPILEDAHVTKGVLDLGCGRGEWLQLLRTKGIECWGVDHNRVFVEQCRSADLDAREADVLVHLRSLTPESLSVITGFHVVEHLCFETLIKLLDEIHRTLKPNGLVILETPNPENFMVGSCCFYTDPTHRNPIPSHTLHFLLESRGFLDISVMKLRPWDAVKLEGDSELIRRFNEFFYSAPDYGIVARKPDKPIDISSAQ